MVGVSDPRRGVPLLLEWFAREGRDLPWRRTYRPYEVLLSEILLQQTRMEAAVPYFLRFLERFPTLEALAGAPEEEVLARGREKAARKGADLLALNAVGQGRGFGDVPNVVHLLRPDGTEEALLRGTKDQVADALLDHVAARTGSMTA